MKKILTLAMLAMLGAVSCNNKETVPAVGGGDLRIVFNTGDLTTKSDPAPSCGDGSAIYLSPSDEPDLVILVADQTDGDIIGWYPSANATLQDGPTTTSMAVSITGLGKGGDTERPVIVYAFANTEGLWATEIGGTPKTLSELKSTLATSAQVESLMFTPLAANTCPTLNGTGRLPLSARGTTTIAGNGNGEVSLQMLRCVAKVTAEFINNTGADLDMYDFHNEFVGMCPTSGLVMAGSDPDTAGSIGDLVGDEALLHIDQGDSQQQSWFVFPSEGPYTCNVSFRLGDDSFSYSDLEVHDDHARDLTELKRNQHLHIVTRISKGLTVSFSFQVMDWTEKTENIIFH